MYMAVCGSLNTQTTEGTGSSSENTYKIQYQVTGVTCS